MLVWWHQQDLWALLLALSWRTVVSAGRSLHHPDAFSNHVLKEREKPLLKSSLRWWEKSGDKPGGPVGVPTRLAKPGTARVFWCPLIYSLICGELVNRLGLSWCLLDHWLLPAVLGHRTVPGRQGPLQSYLSGFPTEIDWKYSINENQVTVPVITAEATDYKMFYLV